MVLHLHRARLPGLEFEKLIPWIDAARELDLNDAAAAHAVLAQRIPKDGVDFAALRRWFEDQRADPGQITDPLVEESARAKAAEGAFCIEVFSLEGAGQAQRIPRGEINVLIPLQGTPSIDGQSEGMLVLPPGATRALRVVGGVMGIVSLRPSAGP